MKKLVMMVMVVMLAGCDSVGQYQNAAEQVESERVTLEGKIKISGGIALLKTEDDLVGLDSYTIDFEDFDGMEVAVSGEYSGEVLYVESLAVK